MERHRAGAGERGSLRGRSNRGGGWSSRGRRRDRREPLEAQLAPLGAVGVDRARAFADPIAQLAQVGERERRRGRGDGEAAAEFEHLKRAMIRIGSMDLKIAAIALTNQGTLLTRNLVDFRKVPGLKAEDWSL